MTEIKILDKPSNVLFITIFQATLENGHRHRMNAEKYMADGNLHHAIGSYIKMIRNYKLAYLMTNLKRWK